VRIGESRYVDLDLELPGETQVEILTAGDGE
jgi:hypothetical protein